MTINESIERRFCNDPIFHRVVETMRGWLSGFPDMGGECGLSTEGLRNAVDMACALHEEEAVRRQREEMRKKVEDSIRYGA